MFLSKFRMIRRQIVMFSVVIGTLIIAFLQLSGHWNPRSANRSKRGDGTTADVIAKFHRNNARFFYTLRQNRLLESSGLSRTTTRELHSRKLTDYSVKKPESTSSPPTSDDITIVTAFFDIGVISKWGGIWRSPETYRNWMWAFRRIENPVVAYFDSAYHAFHFKKVRSYLPSNLTRIVIIKRRFLKSFSYENQIRNIIHRSDYSKLVRHSLKSQYPCVMHSKYELMERSVLADAHKTRYFAWIDIGLFRDLTGQEQFKLALPPNFHEGKISYDQVTNVTMDTKIQSIFHNASTWICGCIFIGRNDLMLKWTRLYMKYMKMFLDMGYAGTDEQVLFAMFSNGIKDKPSISIQAHQPVPQYGPWFSLGYLCKDQWTKTHKRTTT